MTMTIDSETMEMIKKIQEFSKENIDKNLQKLLIGKLDEDIQVFSVNGDFVKINYDMDFDEGGNWMVKEYMPPKEIWIDNDLNNKDHPFVILHEYNEALKCQDFGMTYDDAHENSNVKEKIYRQIIEEGNYGRAI